jgi:hypothetical protein
MSTWGPIVRYLRTAPSRGNCPCCCCRGETNYSPERCLSGAWTGSVGRPLQSRATRVSRLPWSLAGAVTGAASLQGSPGRRSGPRMKRTVLVPYAAVCSRSASTWEPTRPSREPVIPYQANGGILLRCCNQCNTSDNCNGITSLKCTRPLDCHSRNMNPRIVGRREGRTTEGVVGLTTGQQEVMPHS